MHGGDPLGAVTPHHDNCIVDTSGMKRSFDTVNELRAVSARPRRLLHPSVIAISGFHQEHTHACDTLTVGALKATAVKTRGVAKDAKFLLILVTASVTRSRGDLRSGARCNTHN
jgi:hypothetical protein